MSNIKKMIILLIIILLIIMGITIYIVYQNRGQVVHGVDEQEDTDMYEPEKMLQLVKNRNNFYVIKNCITKYYTYCQTMNASTTSDQAEQQRSAEIVYNLLDEEYRNFKNITKDNVLDVVGILNTSVINVNNMYVSERTYNMSVYIVEGTLREQTSGTISDFKVMVKLDSLNRTFSILLEDYIKDKYADLKVGDYMQINVAESIEDNGNNAYDFNVITDETYVQDLFRKYKEEILYNTTLAYEHLDEEYKNKRFGTLESFQAYAKENIRANVIAKISQYQKSVTDEYTQYICIDQNGNYYIFKESAAMNYGLILDTYTLDLPEVVERYNTLEEKDKILFNIQKIFTAINSGDYSYVYNKLDSAFKANYFKTQNDFEQYIKSNWFEKNEVSYGNYEKNEDVYIYNIVIKDADGIKLGTISKKILLKLTEGTNFVMSFNVE